MGREDVEKIEDSVAKQGWISPAWALINAEDENARHSVCSYINKDGRVTVDIFIFDKRVDLPASLKKLESVAGGRVFREVNFVYWLGLQYV